MASLSEIVTVLKAVRRGSEWYACCPAHSDSKPSMSITEKHGAVHFYCHAGCSQSSVAYAMQGLGIWGNASGIALSETQITARRRIRAPITSPRGPRVATYDYIDEIYALLYQVLRYEPGADGARKDFMQRQPDHSSADGWKWNLHGVRPVLYRLPEVLAATQVILVEGEKDVETLRSHGYVATTGAGGAKNWKHEYAAMLAGKRVYVIPDQDESGRLWLGTIANDLPNAEVINLPNKDVTEWFGVGHCKTELDKLITDGSTT